jgi:integrase
MIAAGNTAEHVHKTIQRTKRICNENNIDTLEKIKREKVEKWIAGELQKKILSNCSINHYITAIKAFTQYLADIELLAKNPIKSLKKLNAEIGQKKKRRALTAEEVNRLLEAAEADKPRWRAGERVLIYRLLIGTGLRSTELSLLVPNQIDFNRNRLTIEAAKTKNKKADMLPLRPDLVQSVKNWVKTHGIQPDEKIFRYKEL